MNNPVPFLAAPPLPPVSTPSALPLVVGVATGVLSLIGIGLTVATLRRRARWIEEDDIVSIFPSRSRDGLVLTLDSGDRLELSYRAARTIGRSAKEWRRSQVLDVESST